MNELELIWVVMIRYCLQKTSARLGSVSFLDIF